jgi:hypothetical protein
MPDVPSQPEQTIVRGGLSDKSKVLRPWDAKVGPGEPPPAFQQIAKSSVNSLVGQVSGSVFQGLLMNMSGLKTYSLVSFVSRAFANGVDSLF